VKAIKIALKRRTNNNNFLVFIFILRLKYSRQPNPLNPFDQGLRIGVERFQKRNLRMRIIFTGGDKSQGWTGKRIGRSLPLFLLKINLTKITGPGELVRAYINPAPVSYGIFSRSFPGAAPAGGG
jgi:hypothetical protein